MTTGEKVKRLKEIFSRLEILVSREQNIREERNELWDEMEKINKSITGTERELHNATLIKLKLANIVTEVCFVR